MPHPSPSTTAEIPSRTSIAEPLDQFLPVPGGRVFVRCWGRPSGDGPAPIVLVHESLGCVAMWRDFPAALALATGRSVIAYDRLGFGQSSPRQDLPGFAFIEEEARTIFPQLLDGLGIPSCVVFGHSVGGGMAVTMAALQPARVRAVIAEAAQAAIEERTLAGIRAAQAAFAQPEQFARLAKWHGEKTQWVLDAWVQTWTSPAFRHWSLRPMLEHVHCPVLVIHGLLDEYGSEAFAHTIARHAKGPATLALLENTGHIPHKEVPETVLARTMQFLQNMD